MSAQTSISRLPAVAVAGMRAEVNVDDRVDSRALTTAAGVNAGVLIVEGSVPTEEGALTTDAASVGSPVGFSMFQVSKEPTSPHYKQYDMVPCLRRGRIWLVCSGIIATRAACFIVHATGLPSTTDDATTTPLPTGYSLICLKGAGNGELGLFAVNFP